MKCSKLHIEATSLGPLFHLAVLKILVLLPSSNGVQTMANHAGFVKIVLTQYCAVTSEEVAYNISQS